MTNQPHPEITPREFNLMDYTILDVEFTYVDATFMFSYEGSNDIKSGGKVDLYLIAACRKRSNSQSYPFR